MKGEVISAFRDKFHFNTVYETGAIVDFEEKRMKDLIARKLCKEVKEQEKKETPVPATNDKEQETPKASESKVKEALQEDAVKEETNDGLDEKTKSEQEAAKKIAEAIKKSKK